MEMFKFWLQVDCKANWTQLISALDKINQITLASQINDNVFKGNVMSIATELANY